MNIDPIAVDPVLRMCLPTFYAKVLDARAADPVLGDTLAAETAGRVDFDFRSVTMPRRVAFMLSLRAKHLDGWTREFLADNPEATVLNLGCGLDTRVHRIDPSARVRWFDVDRPAVIEARERLYPARDGYRMVGASVTDPAWLAEVATDLPVLVVCEGLVEYLRPDETYALFNRVTRAFPRGRFVFDAYSRAATRVLVAISRPSRYKLSGGTAIDDPYALEAAVDGLTLMDAVPFLTLPELAGGPVRRGLGRMRSYRKAVRHLRYRF